MPRLVVVPLLGFALLIAAAAGFCQVVTADSDDSTDRPVQRVEFRQDQTNPQSSDLPETETVLGEVIVEALDGGVMLLADDGQLHSLHPESILRQTQVEGALEVVAERELETRLLDQLGQRPGAAGLSIYRTPHYWIVFNCDDAYAKRVGGLFESLYRSFYTYWKNQRWDLPQPRFPLVAVLLKDQATFAQYGQADIDASVDHMIGYYDLSSNRMTTFNVPNWERNVSTIIHEATHQLAYNCGLQSRLADNPTWVSEGLATFFESPDRRNPGRWRGVGRVNRVNLVRWQRYQRRRPDDSLTRLLTKDSRYQNADTAADAYGEGWALTYFLMRARRKQYVDYLRRLSQGQPLTVLTPAARIEMFESAMETSLEEIDQRFVKFMRRVR